MNNIYCHSNFTTFLLISILTKYWLILPCPSCWALIQPPHAQAVTPKSSLAGQRLDNLPFQRVSNSSLQTKHSFTNTTHNFPQGGDFFSAATPQSILQSIKQGYAQRLAADPSFLSKSILEIILAASTQYMAEVGRRGKHRILPEIDFVAAGVLTAVCGKYYSMWRVAKTVAGDEDGNDDVGNKDDKDGRVSKNYLDKNNWKDKIPTNAFQPTLLDGRTKPTPSSRVLALLLPMPELFRAGVIASAIGYGMTSILIQFRAILIPDYVASTVPVSVLGAAVYTGVFMAIVSNIRYQILQGVIEPYLIEKPFQKMQLFCQKWENNTGVMGMVGRVAGWRGWNQVKGLVIVFVRWVNGLLGSWIAIGGMRACGLQKVKS
eukprot:CCRYP_004782-RA/>CCRYP_004782-RA protein AED:0.03 eAED:0.03 QI:206/1/1/1/0/0/2/476/375